ncbi:hypothetical protein B0H14DRAFT_3554372 [Mycena olivaceomarginata]|nr:hypothetical protein B0H14DRAFT_3554372 [Mycena olivaceomarginata]
MQTSATPEREEDMPSLLDDTGREYTEDTPSIWQVDAPQIADVDDGDGTLQSTLRRTVAVAVAAAVGVARPLAPVSLTYTTLEALFDHDYTYFMDEADKTWLDNTNYQCRAEEQIAQETPSADTDEVFIRVSISEDEFELVMGLFEILTGPKLQQELPDFSFFKPFFLAPLRPDTFASQVVPAWIRPPSVLSSIALTIHPHWQQRRSLRGGRKIFPSLNSEENDHIDAAYAKVGGLQADSSAQNVADELEKLEKVSPRRSQRLNPQRAQHVQGRAGKDSKEPSCATPDYETKVPVGSGVPETATQNGTKKAQPLDQAQGLRGEDDEITHAQSLTDCYRTDLHQPISSTRGSQDLPFDREGTSTGKTPIIPATRVSGSQHIPSSRKKSSGDVMADSLTGDEARPLLICIPAQTPETKTSRHLDNHSPARDENNFFTGRFTFPPTLLERVQGPLRADGTNFTSVIIDPIHEPTVRAGKEPRRYGAEADVSGTGRAYAYGTILPSSSEELTQRKLQTGHHRRSAPSEKRDFRAEAPQIGAPAVEEGVDPGVDQRAEGRESSNSRLKREKMWGEWEEEDPLSINLQVLYTAIGMAETRTLASPEPVETNYKQILCKSP